MLELLIVGFICLIIYKSYKGGSVLRYASFFEEDGQIDKSAYCTRDSAEIHVLLEKNKNTNKKNNCGR